MIPELIVSAWLLVYPPIQPLTLFPDNPDWYVLDIGETGCEKYGWPVACGEMVHVLEGFGSMETDQ